MAFVDEVKIRVESGAGGNGCISFRREKYVPRGGPDGGNGGTGGSVLLQATHDKSSLLDFKYQPRFQAKRGEHGKGSDMDGRGGEDLVLQVPVGTLVYDAETGDQLGDLRHSDDQLLVAEGGRGGRGNRTFVSSTLRAPRIATPGKEGEARDLRLELRLLADVGLVGLPNAGKSSFLKAVTRANPKVADYPFTTLEPGLGVVYHKDQSFVVADLPGLIEGASTGAGLGHRFLKHVSRNRVLLHLVDSTTPLENLVRHIEIVRNEMRDYDEALPQIPEHLVFTKCDLLADDARKELESNLFEMGLRGYFISSHTGWGVAHLLDRLASNVTEWRKEDA